jgi:iron complex outermembrane receptor protein
MNGHSSPTIPAPDQQPFRPAEGSEGNPAFGGWSPHSDKRSRRACHRRTLLNCALAGLLVLLLGSGPADALSRSEAAKRSAEEGATSEATEQRTEATPDDEPEGGTQANGLLESDDLEDAELEGDGLEDLQLDETELGDDFSDIDLFELDVPVVVTASRHEQEVRVVPYAISVITQEDIRRTGARTIPDALRLAAGMDVADLRYSASAVSLRGSHGLLSRSVLVLVDGRQVYDSMFGGTLWGSWPFQLEDIAQIEVIRGPAGVTWGANAVNGVINIITKHPDDQQGVVLTLGGASRGSYKIHAGYGFKDQNLSMRISSEFEGSDGFTRGGMFLSPLDDDYHTTRATAHAVYEHSPEDTFTFSIGSSLVDGGYSPPLTAGFGTRTGAGSLSSYLLAKWSHRISDHNQYDITAYLNDAQASPGTISVDYRYQQLALQFNHTFVPAKNHKLNWGVDTRLDLLDTSESDPRLLSEDYLQTATIGGYLQDDWEFAPRWTLTLGGRLDYDSYGGFEPSGRLALAHEVDDTNLVYGSISRAFQMQPTSLRYLDLPQLNGLAVVTTVSNLKPETLWAYEIGWRAQPLERLNTSLTLFWHDYDEVTATSATIGPPALVEMLLDNRGSSELYGLEFETRYRVREDLTLLGNYTYQQLNWHSSASFIDKDFMTPPRHKFMVGARYDATEDLHLSSHLYFVDSVEAPSPNNPFGGMSIDSYYRLDVVGEYEFWEDRASLMVGGRNLLDSHHPEGATSYINNAEVPRMFFAEVRLAIPSGSRRPGSGSHDDDAAIE